MFNVIYVVKIMFAVSILTQASVAWGFMSVIWKVLNEYFIALFFNLAAIWNFVTILKLNKKLIFIIKN